MISYISALVLGIASVQDIKEKQIYMLYPLAIAGLGLVSRLYLGERLVSVPVIFLCAGIILLSVVTKEKMGMGDSLIIASLLLTFGIKLSVRVFFEAFILLSLYNFVFEKKVGKHKEIPFVPFLFVAFCLCLII